MTRAVIWIRASDRGNRVGTAKWDMPVDWPGRDASIRPCQLTLAADQQIVSTVYATVLTPKTAGDSYRSSRMTGGTKLALLLPW
jgi:hypothetical protein